MPDGGVGLVALWHVSESGEISNVGSVGQGILDFTFSLDFHEHEVLGLFSIWQSSNVSLLLWNHTRKVVVDGSVRPGVLGRSISSVKNSSNFRSSVVDSVHSPVLEIMRQPSLVDHNATRLFFIVQMGIERHNDIEAFLAVFELRNAHLVGHVVDASDLDRLERPFPLELFHVLSNPRERLGA